MARQHAAVQLGSPGAWKHLAAAALVLALAPCTTQAACFHPTAANKHLSVVNGQAVVRYTLDDYRVANKHANYLLWSSKCTPKKWWHFHGGPCNVDDSVRLIEQSMRQIAWQLGNTITFQHTTHAECNRIATATPNSGKCLRFSYSNRYNYGGSAYSGTTGTVSLGKYWQDTGRIYHELGHALGMAHEQQRPDRDQYLTLQKKSIYDAANSKNFWNNNLAIYPLVDPSTPSRGREPACETYSTEFDYESLSLYWDVNRKARPVNYADGIERIQTTPRYIEQGRPAHDWTKGLSRGDMYAMWARFSALGVNRAAALAKWADPAAYATELARLCPDGYNDEPTASSSIGGWTFCGKVTLYETLPGWATDVTHYSAATSPCNVPDFVAKLQPGSGYYTDPGVTGGFCREIAPANLNGVLGAHVSRRWTTHHSGKTNLPHQFMAAAREVEAERQRVLALRCPTGMYRIGTTGYVCKPCSRTICWSGTTRVGTCSGFTNGYSCKKHMSRWEGESGGGGGG